MILCLIKDILVGANCDATDSEPEANGEGQAEAENTIGV